MGAPPELLPPAKAVLPPENEAPEKSAASYDTLTKTAIPLPAGPGVLSVRVTVAVADGSCKSHFSTSRHGALVVPHSETGHLPRVRSYGETGDEIARLRRSARNRRAHSRQTKRLASTSIRTKTA